MPTQMWRVEGQQLKPLGKTRLEQERRLEDWIEADPSLLGFDLLLIGRQVPTDHGGFIDLLGVDDEGNVAVLELKRDRTPREVVAQVLDYGSWVATLSPKRIHEIADEYLARKKQGRFADAFREAFGTGVPDGLNTSHSLFVVASEFDESSKRIVEYLAKRHSVEINTVFFNFFRDGDREYLAADWLMEQTEVKERSDAKTKAPWSGDWYVNVASGPGRSWEDARRFGFVAAGGGRRYSEPLNRLSVGDRVYAYQKGHGYVGVGRVVTPATQAKNFVVKGKPLFDHPLEQPAIAHHQEDEELAEYVVGIKWERTVPSNEAKWTEGAFANQNVVCKLRDEKTLEFLRTAFGS